MMYQKLDKLAELIDKNKKKHHPLPYFGSLLNYYGIKIEVCDNDKEVSENNKVPSAEGV